MEEMQISTELEEKIRKAKSLDEVTRICNEAGVQITKEQLESEMLPGTDTELSEAMLDNVSGGGIVRLVCKIISIYRSNRSNGDGRGGRFSAGSFGGGRGGGGIR